MRPAFPSNRSAAGFTALLLGLLLLPTIAGKSWLPTREQAYAAQGWGYGPFPWIRNQIFEETNDIDIAIVGSSRIFYDIDTPYVQAKLSEQLGRPAVVRTIGWSGAGYDALYFFTRDLLAHRRVRLLVFYDEEVRGRGRNRQIPFLFQWRDDSRLLTGLPMADQSFYYYAAILEMPRNLLAQIRPDQPAPLAPTTPKDWLVVANAPNPATRLGSFATRQGFRPTPDSVNGPFEPFTPSVSANPEVAVVYSDGTKTDFEFTPASFPTWEARFIHEFAGLMEQHGIRPVQLDLPALKYSHSSVIHERAFWPENFPGGISLLGIPQEKLLGSMTEADAEKLLWDPYHLNENGQAYFTRAITPALLKLYENQPGH